MTAFYELAERCEAATAADRELDFLIAEMCDEHVASELADLADLPNCRDLVRRHVPYCRYTASLDAAMALADGWFKVEPDSLKGWRALGKMGTWCHAATPALALCAAALRARGEAA